LGDVSPAALLRALALLVLSIGAMQFFLYELVPSALGGALAQFLCAAAQGYVCGCFYPYTFFPEALQHLGAALPAGTALRYLSGVLRGAGGYAGALLLWALAFLALSAAVRALRYRRAGA
jgi:ABC-type multidrug transport system permease subunit